MSRSRIEFIIIFALLAALFAVSLVLRVALPWSHVFSGDTVKFTDNDAYFYMRLLDNLAAHFPQLTDTDRYFYFPGDYNPHNLPLLFVYLMGAVAWLLGGGAPSQHLVDLVGVYFPPVMGALMVFPAFFITKTVFNNKWAGLPAAAVITLLPGEFLIRTLLGNTDIHVMEIFTTTLFMLFLLLAVNSGKKLELKGLLAGNRRILIHLLIYAALAGLMLGAYLLSWDGALLFVLISFTWIVVQFISDHIKGRPTAYLGISGCGIYAIALLMVLPSGRSAMTLAALLIGLAATAGLWILSRLLRRHNLPVYYYPAGVLLLALTGMGALWIVRPDMLQTIIGTIAGFFTWQTGTTTAEMQPLLMQNGSFTLALFWGNYTLSSLFALAALCLLAYRAFSKSEPESMLLLTWTLITLLATLAMRRFAYYLAVDIAVLAGYAYWLLFCLMAGLNNQKNAQPVQAQTKKGKSKRAPAKQQVKPSGWLPGQSRLALAMTATAVLIVYPNTGPLPGGDRPFFDVTQKGLYTQSAGWSEALDWLKGNTAQPLTDASAYNSLFKTSTGQEKYEYPASAYSVLSWWDYGYWITRTGQRIPYSNPGTAQRGEQYFLTAGDEISATRLSSNWGVKYVMLDNYLTDWQTGFRVLCSTAGKPLNNYCEIYYRQQNGSLSPTLLYYPEYYRTMAVRLYCFDADPYLPAETAVISWQAKTSSDGLAYKEITDLKTFRNYNAALEYASAAKDGSRRIVGKDPDVSPIPLDGLNNYHPVYRSDQAVSTGKANSSVVKIFEYKRDAIPVSGDWNGDGKWTIGLWETESGYWMMDINGDGLWNAAKGDKKSGPFGRPFEIPVTGDWNGDGKTEVGTWSPAELCFYLDYNGNGIWDSSNGDIRTGQFGDGYYNKPLTGDWTGSGRWQQGIYRQTSTFHNAGLLIHDQATDNSTASKTVQLKYIPLFASAGEIPITGDWTGSGIYRGGFWNPQTGMFSLDISPQMDDNENRIVQSAGPAGTDSDTPVAGDWNGDGKSETGIWNPSSRCFYLDMNGDCLWKASDGDLKLGPFTEN